MKRSISSPQAKSSQPRKRDWVHWALIGAVVFLVGVNVVYILGRDGFGPKAGERAPDFTLPALVDGSESWADTSLSQFRGKVVVLNFFSTS